MSIDANQLKIGHYYRVTYENHFYGQLNSKKNVYTVLCNKFGARVTVLTRNGEPDSGDGYCYGATLIEEISEHVARSPLNEFKTNQDAIKLLRGNL